MQRIELDREAPDPAVLEPALTVLRGGGLVVYPTDTLYGIACDPASETAVRRLCRLKRRPPDRPLPLIASDPSQAGRVADLEDPIAGRLIRAFWPGPLTLVAVSNPRAGLAASLRGRTVAVRVPACPAARALAAGAGLPIPATSANRSGEAPPASPGEISGPIRAAVDLILDAGRLPGGLPSTILDLTVRPPRILRPGAIPEDRLARFLL